jgi:hypothetical protein
MRIPKLIPAAVLLVLAAPALHAEKTAKKQAGSQKAQPSQPAKGKTLFAEMDTDHDGKITRAEWKGNAIGFSMLDTNGDGVLSGDELKPKQ